MPYIEICVTQILLQAFIYARARVRCVIKLMHIVRGFGGTSLTRKSYIESHIYIRMYTRYLWNASDYSGNSSRRGSIFLARHYITCTHATCGERYLIVKFPLRQYSPSTAVSWVVLVITVALILLRDLLDRCLLVFRNHRWANFFLLHALCPSVPFSL